MPPAADFCSEVQMYCSTPNVMAEVEAFVATRPLYSINQENGQRKYGPPKNWEGPAPPKGSEVFVAKLPRDLFEPTLIPLFEKVGRIYEFRLMMDFSGSNRGFAFVMYTNVEDAENAISTYDDYEIRPGHKIGVCKSVDNCRLFVGGIPKDKTKMELMAEFKRLTDGVKDVILYSNVNDKTKNRGFAFVEYESHRAAAMARRRLIPGKASLWGHEIAVDWAEPEPQVGEEIMRRYLRGRLRSRHPCLCDGCSYERNKGGKVTVLYARNLTARTTEDHLQQIFSLGGLLRIDKVKKIRDFAFVHYISRSEAELALSRLNGYVIDGCPIEVTWAKPPQCALRNQTRVAVEGYRSYPRSLGIFSEAQTQLLNERIANSFQQQIRREAAMLRSSVENEALYCSGGAIQPKSIQPNLFREGLSAIKFPMILSYLCHERGWGEPKYDVTDIAQNIVDNPPLFSCKVTIPNLPSEANTFMSSKLGHSPEESRVLAAQFAILKLDLSPETFDYFMPRNVLPPIEPPSNNGIGHFPMPPLPTNEFGCIGDGINLRRSSPRQPQPVLGSGIRNLSLDAFPNRGLSLEGLSKSSASLVDVLANFGSSVNTCMSRNSSPDALASQNSSIDAMTNTGCGLDSLVGPQNLEAFPSNSVNLEGMASCNSCQESNQGTAGLESLGAVGGIPIGGESKMTGGLCISRASPPMSAPPSSPPPPLHPRVSSVWNNCNSGDELLSLYELLSGVNSINFSM